jgi:hypothetical protein
VSNLNEEFDVEALRERVQAEPGCAEFPALAELERLAGRPERAREISEAGLAESPSRLAGRVSLGLSLLDLGESAEAVKALRPILEPILEPHRLAADAFQAANDPSFQASPTPASTPTPAWPTPASQPGHSGWTGSEAERDDESDEAIERPAPLAATPISMLAHQDQAQRLDEALEESEIDVAFEQAETRPEEMISANRMAEEALLRSDLLCGEESIPEASSEPMEALDAYELEEAPSYRTETMANLLEQQGDRDAARAIRERLEQPKVMQAEADESIADASASAMLDEGISDDLRSDLQSNHQSDLQSGPQSGSIGNGAGGAGRRARILSTLEGWLQNIQRGAA